MTARRTRSVGRRVTDSPRSCVAAFSLRVAGPAVVAALSLLVLDSAGADSGSPTAKPPKPRLLFVDADHPATWPQGLEPIAAGDLRRLLAGEPDESSAARVQIEQAVYHATFRDGVLRDGKAELTLGSGDRPAVVPLEQRGSDASHLLDFTHPRWDDAPRDSSSAKERGKVLRGIDRGGSRVVIAPRNCSRLTFDWSLTGRSALGATEFALSLPPAVVSQLVLSVPSELSLESDQGVLQSLHKDEAGRATSWQLELGSRSSCRLRVTPKVASGERRVFYDKDTTLVVAGDRSRLQSKLNLDVFGVPLHTLRLSVPAGLRVETITYGDDFPLVVPPSSPERTREISLELPEPLIGKGRTISIEASAATRTKQLWELPQVEVAGALLREGQLQMTIRAPLKLQRFGRDGGLRQSEAPTFSIDGEETFLLRQNASDPPLAIEVAEPAPALAARTLARLDLQRDRCSLAADITCTASGGSTFSVTFELPDAWDVARVEAIGDVSRIIDETSRAAGEHRKRVKIDFFRAVTDREPKRFRVEASRPLPRSGESIDLPVIEFPAFASQEVETLIVHGSSIELGLGPADAFAAFDPAAILAVLPDSPLRPDRMGPGRARMLAYRWTSQTAKAHVTVRRGEELLSARLQTSVDVGAAEQIKERIDATIVPASPVDRVLVYLSAEGAQFSWSVLPEQKRPLEAVRLGVARHAEWNLPEAGELWEIRLPEPHRREFHLQAARRTSALGGARIGVAFIPGARNFEGTVELHLPDARQFDVEARDPLPRLIELGGRGGREERTVLRESPPPESPSSQARTSAHGNKSGVVRVFHYDRQADVLVVRPRPSGASNAAARFVELRLTSFLGSGSADDLHRAEYSVAPELSPQPFRFHLDADCRLGSVAVNGRHVRVQRRGDEVIVPALPADLWNRVRIEYRTAGVRRLFCEARPIVVPRAEAELLGFEWRLFLAPGLEPGGSPLGLRFDEPLPALSWMERIFGPLGRSASQMRLSSWKPEAWMVDLVGTEAEPEGWTPADIEVPPAGWSQWDVTGEEVPADVRLTIWHAGKFRTLAWIIALGCLSAGLMAWRLFPGATRRLGPFALAGAVSFALAAPSPYALLAGACVSGMLAALLLARPWKSPAAPTPSLGQGKSRPGSTVSFELRAVSLLLAVSVVGAMAGFAQEIPPSLLQVPRDAPSRPAAGDARSWPAAADGELLVVVPVHPDQVQNSRGAALPGNAELVYCTPGALEALRRRAEDAPRNEGIVWLASDYVIALDERQPARIEATYRVALLPGPARSLLLRLKNVTLAGANACRVDGQPSPIRVDDEGFVLSLDPNAAPVPAQPVETKTVRTRRPIAAERPGDVMPPPDKSGSNVDREQPRVYEIRLACFPKGEPGPERFEIGVPETARTTVRIAPGGPWQTIEARTAEGKTRRLRPGDQPIDVGPTDQLKIKSGPVLPESAAATINAQAVQFWRLSPTLLEMDCRVTYDRENSRAERLTWLVPAGAVVRTASDAYRAALRAGTPQSRQASSATVAPNGAQSDPLVPVDFDISAMPDGPLTLAATLLLPLDADRASGGQTVTVPLPRFDAGSADQPAIAVTSSQLGISAAPGYQVVAATTEPNLAHSAKVDPIFRQESFGAHKEPDVILDCQGVSALPLQLASVVPAHKVRLMTHEARVSADRIRWKTTAEIRTENAPAFVHVLHVDPRLKIDSISVREDDVERLVRFSQTGDEVTLFLRDRAAATQDLVLTGHLPLEAGQSTKLPSVSLEHAVVSEVRLVISHDADLDVSVAEAPGVRRVKGGGRIASARAADEPTADVLEYSLAPGAAPPEIRVARRPETAQDARAPSGAPTKGPKRLVAGTQEPAAKRPANESSPAANLPTGELVRRDASAKESGAADATRQPPRVRAVLALELHREGPAVGSTHVLLERFGEPSLRFLWPASAVLRGALLDGRPVQPVLGDSWISVAIPSEPTPHRVTLYWENRSESAVRGLGRLRADLPVPADGVVNSVLLTVTAPAGFQLWAPAHVTRLDSQSFAGECRSIQLPDQNADENDSNQSIAVVSPKASAQAHLLGRLWVGPTEARFAVWAVDASWLRVPLAMAVFLLVALVVRHPLAARGRAWLAARPQLLLAGIGLVWWLGLSPRAVGPLLIVMALGWLIVELRRQKSTRAPNLPSTLHVPSGTGLR